MTPRPDTGSLAALLAQATQPDENEERIVARAVLCEHSIDTARLLVDMAEELLKHSSANEHDYVSHAKADALLARFAALEARAGEHA